MFCTNCGNRVSDDAVFCTNCGVKLYRPPVEEQNPWSRPAQEQTAVQQEQVMTPQEVSTPQEVPTPQEVAVQQEVPMPWEVTAQQEEIMAQRELSHATTESVVPVNISVQPIPSAPDSMIAQNGNIGIQQGGAVRTKIILPLALLSVLWAVLTIGCAVIEMIDGRTDIPDLARLIEICITSVVLILYACVNNGTASVLKGIALLILMISDIIFMGYSSIEYAINSLNKNVSLLASLWDVSEGLIESYMVVTIVCFITMYIFFFIDALRALAGTVRMKALPLFFGYIAAIGFVSQIVIKIMIQKEIELYLGFLPVNLIYIFIIAAIMTGISSKKKISKK